MEEGEAESLRGLPEKRTSPTGLGPGCSRTTGQCLGVEGDDRGDPEVLAHDGQGRLGRFGRRQRRSARVQEVEPRLGQQMRAAPWIPASGKV